MEPARQTWARGRGEGRGEAGQGRLPGAERGAQQWPRPQRRRRARKMQAMDPAAADFYEVDGKDLDFYDFEPLPTLPEDEVRPRPHGGTPHLCWRRVPRRVPEEGTSHSPGPCARSWG